MNTPKGFRDFKPYEEKLRKKMLNVIEEKFRLYGFSPISTPAAEFLEVLTAKGGEEIKEQIFKIEGEEIGLRFDLTVPLARFVSSNLDLYKPFKRYAIDKVWRNEEPQKMRYREFIQADADIIGVKEVTAEIELLYLAEDVLKALGFDLEKMRFTINNKKFLFSFAEYYEIEDERFFRAIDKLDKIGREGVIKELKEIKNGKKAFEILEKERSNLELVKEFNQEAYEELKEIKKHFNRAELELTLVRGLDYYTGSIFEVKHEGVSVVGGGRYDKLTSIFGVEDYAVGISFGFERLYYLKLDRLKNKKYNYANVYVAFVGNNFDYAFEIAMVLRKNKIACDMNYSKRSLKTQLNYADKMGYRFVVIVGDKERKESSYVLKDLINKEEIKLGKEDLLDRLGRGLNV